MTKIVVYAYGDDRPGDNVGDSVGPYVARALGYEVETVTPGAPVDETAYLLCGSIANHARTDDVVMGCGVAWRTDILHSRAQYVWTRGPITALRVWESGGQVQHHGVYGDTAYVLPLLLPGQHNEDGPRGWIPHYVSDTSHFIDGHDSLVISTKQPVESFVADILKCREVVSASLHGIVIANAYGIPAGWWGLDEDRIIGDRTKYRDHYRDFEREPGRGIKSFGPAVDSANLLRLLRENLP